MKKLTLAACALVALPVATSAAVSELQVQISPPIPEHVFDWEPAHRVTVSGNGTAVEYRFELERIAPVRYVEDSTVWSGAGTFTFDGESLIARPGTYELRVMAREQAARKEILTRVETFRIRDGSRDVIKTKNQVQVLRNAARAKRVLVEAFMAVKRRQAAGLDVTALCTSLHSSEQVIGTLINPGAGSAPEGGPAFIAGQGDYDLGAVGIELVQGCEAATAWSGVEFNVWAPAYPSGDAQALNSQFVAIEYGNVVKAGEMKARFDRAVQRVRDGVSAASAGDFNDEITSALYDDRDLQDFLNADSQTGLPAPGGGVQFIQIYRQALVPEVETAEWDLSAGLGIIGLDVNEGASLENLEVRLEMKPYPSDGSGIPAQSAVIRYTD